MSRQSVALFAIVIMAVSAGAASTSQGGTAGPARAPEPASTAPSLEAMVAEALEKSAELAALRGRIEAVEASVRPAGALPDPMAVVALSNVPVGGLELDRTPMTGVEVGLEQQVPASEKRRLRRQVRSEEAEALWGRYDDLCNDTKRRVKKAYYDVQLLGETLRIAQANKGVAKDLLETAEALYATGKGLQQDVFRAQVRLSRMIDEAVAAREGRAAAGTRLNRLLYRPARQPVPELAALGREELRLDPEELAARALEQNPRMLALTKQVEQTKTKTELAKAGLRPDYKLGFRYRIRQEIPMDPAFGDDFWSASVAISLPWLYRSDTVDQEVRGAEATRAAAEAELEALRNELGARVEELVVEGKRLDEQITLLETALLPQAEGALSSSWSAYETGRVELLTVLDNHLNLYHLHLRRSRLLAERKRMLAELEYVVGGAVSAAGGAGGG